VSVTPQDRPFEFGGRRAHLLGAGGCGMSGLARMLAARGVRVTGSDQTATDVTAALDRDGVPVAIEPTGELPSDADLLVVSAAIAPDHPQWLAAESRGVPVLTYAQCLGRCMAGRTGVAIAGTHGKSTTVAMLGHALIHSGLDPTVIVGATCAQLSEDGSTPVGFRLGSAKISAGDLAGASGLLIAEACEFNRSFHHLAPTVASISAVEADHLDIYGSLEAVIEAFNVFARKLPPAAEGGRLLIGHDGAHRREIAAGVKAKVETLGFSPSADWTVDYAAGSRRVTLACAGRPVTKWTCALPGEHNALNSAFAAAHAITLGAEPSKVGEALSSFRGLARRLENLGMARGVRVYDDYGHHPTEIEATLRALREAERPQARGGRLVCVFQPHQHSRTRFLLDEFAQSFSQADIVIVPHIYFVRDSQLEMTKVAAGDLVDRLRARGVQAMHLYPFEAIVEQLQIVCRPGDLLVVMGAGPVWKVARGYMQAMADDDLPAEPRVTSRVRSSA
jgi:UDP-N-acetylmuramate--alanine ligase